MAGQSHPEHIHFVTGQLAQHSLHEVVAQIANDAPFSYSIDVLPITVAALMTPAWIARHVNPPENTTRVLLPGYCTGDFAPLAQTCGTAVECGPRDLRRLPEFFGAARDETYGAYDIEILAEINHCPQLALAEILDQARSLAAAGADIIDVGCNPGDPWPAVADAVSALRDAGHRVSIDSMNPAEIEPAVRAGAELVLSVNATNRAAAVTWGCEVVAIPDAPGSLQGFEETIELLTAQDVPFRLDPILEPIGFGFAASLVRYDQVRQAHPDAEIMMGIGNLTELTDADSAGINVLLLAFCQELGIRSVLTTQVINWARTSVRECDLARRLVHHAINTRQLPKHVEPGLILLRDEAPTGPSLAELKRLADAIRDHNLRIFASAGELHVVTAGTHLRGTDPFELFAQLLRSGPDGGPPKHLDAAHAFYVGYEICKAHTALCLDKQYEQDEPLDWGYLSNGEGGLGPL